MTPAQQQTAYRQHLRWHRQQERAAIRVVLARFGQIQHGLGIAIERTSVSVVLSMVNMLVTEDMHLAMLSTIYVTVGTSAAQREYDRLLPTAKAEDLAMLTKERDHPKPELPKPTTSYTDDHHADSWRRRLLNTVAGPDTRARVVAMASKTRSLITGVLESAVSGGWAVAKTIRNLRNVVVDRTRALLIARTEVTRAYGMGAEMGADSTDLQLYKQWVANRDDRVRPDHAEMNSKPPIPKDGLFVVGGRQMKYPGDPAGGAAQCVNCRCWLLHVPAPTLPLTDN